MFLFLAIVIRIRAFLTRGRADMKKIFCTCFILSLPFYSISYAQSTMAPDGSYVGGDSFTMAPDGSYVGGDSYSSTPYGSSESTNDTLGQDWNNFGQ